MNLLIDELPDSILVAGKVYPVRSDFRTGLRCMLALESEELTDTEKYIVVLQNLYAQVPPEIDMALRQALKFLNGGKDTEPAAENPLRLFSWERDSRYIYSAFKQTHGIDLASAVLHWWVFLALFMDLGKDTTFCSLIGLRNRVWTGKATKEEKELAEQLGESFDVPEPDTSTMEQRQDEAEFDRALGLDR